MAYVRFANVFHDLLIPEIQRYLGVVFTPKVIRRWADGNVLPTHQQFADLIENLTKAGLDNDLLELLKVEWRTAMLADPAVEIRIRLRPGLSESNFDLASYQLQQDRRVTVVRKGRYAAVEGSKAEIADIETVWHQIVDGITLQKFNTPLEQLVLPVRRPMGKKDLDTVLAQIRGIGVIAKIKHLRTRSSRPEVNVTLLGSQRQLDRARILWDEALFGAGIRNKPVIPEPGPASVFRPTDAGFEIDAKLSPANEASEPNQRTIYSRLLTRVNRLKNSIQRLQNSNPELYDEFHDYASLLTGDAGQLDVASIWSVGSALSDLVDAHDPEKIGGMTEPLESTLLMGLRAAIRDHTAFVEGTAVGREMRERVARYRLADKTPRELTALAGPTLKALLSVDNLLATGARHLVGALNRAIDVVSDTTMPVAVSSIEVSKNAVLGVARFAYAALLAPEVANAVLGAMGVDHAAMAAVTALFREHEPAILALTVDEPQLQSFVVWTIANIKKRKS